MCKLLASTSKKLNKNKTRVVVITCGPNPAYCAQFNFVEDHISFFGSYVPVYTDEKEIIDTNGAGDAFAGGFLSKYVGGNKLEECMAAGHWASSIIIKQRGFQIPENIFYKGC